MAVFAEQGIAAGDPDPLVASHDALTVRIKAPFKQIMKDRPDNKEGDVDGSFMFVDTDGSEFEFDIKIRTRGNNRRDPDICPFAPLRLDFDKDDLDDTLFDKQNKLKLVTHCNNSRRVYEEYKQSVIREYLAYRVLNVLTDFSFNVRLLHITYEYTDEDDKELVTYAFLIESKGRMGKRIGLEEQEMTAMSITLLDQEYTNLTAVFQYLIGNMDWSPVLGASGEVCCHNYSIFSADNQTYWSIPYDFDRTGWVEAAHVEPNPEHKRRSMRQRKYRGFCYNNDFIPASLQKFRDKRADIEAVVAAQTELEKSHRNRLESYVEEFYKRLEKEDKVIKSFEKNCR